VKIVSVQWRLASPAPAPVPAASRTSTSAGLNSPRDAAVSPRAFHHHRLQRESARATTNEAGRKSLEKRHLNLVTPNGLEGRGGRRPVCVQRPYFALPGRPHCHVYAQRPVWLASHPQTATRKLKTPVVRAVLVKIYPFLAKRSQ
jgi:hypothetical protein